MRIRLLAALLALSPAAAGAQPVLGLRLAFAQAAGSAARHVPVFEAVAWHVPIQADALWSLDPVAPLAAGGYASWGPGAVGPETCRDGASCLGQVLRAGAQARWTFPPGWLGAAPWVGGAVGWEWAWARRARAGARTTTRFSGPEVAAQGGAQWRLGRFALGPYALVALGRYGAVALDSPEASASGVIADRAFHAWFHLGVSGTYDL